MPAFRIVYIRDETRSPETITASFNDLDQALSVFGARGLRVLYIAESGGDERVPEGRVLGARRGNPPKPSRSSFPLRRFSARVMA